MSLLFLVAVVLAFVAVVVMTVKLMRRRSSAGLETLVVEQQITSTPEVRETVRRHEVTARRFRVFGTASGLAIGVMVLEVGSNYTVLFSTSWLVAAVAGYFVGSFVGSWRLGVSAGGTRRSASLVVRKRSDFVPDLLVQATYFAAVGSVVFLIASFFEDSGQPSGNTGFRLLLTVSTVLAAIAADLGSRRIARAARPSGADDVGVAFDALARLHAAALVSAGLSLSLWLLSWSAFAARPKTGHPLFLGVTCVLVGITMAVASVVVWVKSRRYRTRGGSVRLP
jgi:hypothetical protein